ncbi:putative protein kinase RLK-Pelle-LRR-XI-1 family [Helianthus annuus]|uniref:non-specific serine/threonine protein kinase n=1 Tax=Helianthus annuus TaxID=4232 RepID=A0A9K3H4K8_HELAN|nr:putative protein kinase RLK-Pelle-LRR-XI-1 family [Helianthus annuus]KAJ0453344.1 putative protein kinase RLK-Pelle-LRR-XI-1 family [Helianthus annuus]KAJ0475268.1 putative protein kinase RLK-Pelle-LRR-XI-1 family [Helianthus annuus]KAJ0650825.1 putative protein kinase RLK-Pelle-LRR-XI-1 family [Helianthus annuus]
MEMETTRRRRSLLFLFSLLVLPFYLVSGLSSDGLNLLSLMTHWTSVPPSIYSTWNASHPTPCSWVGVHCNPNNHHVHSLNLSSYLISGHIGGPELANLTHLTSLDLSFNNLSGPLPPQLGNCTRLRYLDLSYNILSGPIPHTLGNLIHLTQIILYSNKLTGSIPYQIGNLSNLEELDFSLNHLTGTIPESLWKLQNLRVLSLYGNSLLGSVPFLVNAPYLEAVYLTSNQLSGPISSTIGNLSNLVDLQLDSNQFWGPIPSSIGKCSRLQTLMLGNNRFTGELPNTLNHLSQLTKLDVHNNSLKGSIRFGGGNCLNLVYLDISFNQFHGLLPHELGNCSSLNQVAAVNSGLGGSIPSSIGEVPLGIWKIKGLKKLNIYNNNLSGELPDEVAGMKQLREITLYNNRFTGAIPQGLGINSSLTVIDFTNNSFTGKIPPSLCFRKQLQRLLLGYNYLQGSVPHDVGSCSSLSRLILQHNNLTGVLPEFMENRNMLYMNLRGNFFSGKIPASFGKLTNITEIDLSMNKLSGNIPLELGNLVQIQALNISYNELQGPLPSQLGNCSRLLEFDASHNSVSGSIPAAFGKLTQLSTLSLSDNHFSGEIPHFISQLQDLIDLQLGGNSFSGHIPSSIVELHSLNRLNLSSNKLIGGIPSNFRKMVMLEHLDVSHNNLTGDLASLGDTVGLVTLDVSFNHFTGPIPATLLKSISSSSFVGNTGLCVDCCIENSNIKPCVVRSRGLKKRHYIMIAVGMCLFVMVVYLVLYLAVICRRKQKQEMDMLAEGCCSSLVIKALEATENLNDKYIIGRGAHGTVYKACLGHGRVYAVKRLGFGGGQTSMKREVETVGKVRHRNLVTIQDVLIKKDYSLILYKYMENGSLYDVLYEKEPTLVLSWSVRYRIALGTAQGLAYLHFDCDPVIIHRDIKPMNILLDGDMEAHISDFGIAKLLDQSATGALATSTLMGTIGYIAPENAFTRSASRELDVYSYGVVLLELISRQKPVLIENVDMVSWVRSRSEEIEKIVDRGLLEEIEEDKRVREQVRKVVLVALRCTEWEPTRRPTMREVVKCLQDSV